MLPILPNRPSLIVFLDIETVPLYPSLEEMKRSDPYLYDLWESKYYARRPESKRELSPEQYFLEEAGIHAAFSRVVCIGLGKLFYDSQEKDYFWDEEVISDLNERELLHTFYTKWGSILGKDRDAAVCGHNIRNFDLPFIGRRRLINKLPLPPLWVELLRSSDSKRQGFSINIVDTMQMWNFGSMRGTFISLEELAKLLGLSFSKSLNHHEIRERFYDWQATGDKRYFKDVEDYCIRDVRAVAWCYLAMTVSDYKDISINTSIQSKIPPVA